MDRRSFVFVFVVVAIVTAFVGCATPYAQGRKSLSQGRYDAAASRFQETLAQHPNQSSALVGLGIARYKLGAYDDAVDILGRAVAQEPTDPLARLYLALAYLQKGEDAQAQTELQALAALKPEPR